MHRKNVFVSMFLVLLLLAIGSICYVLLTFCDDEQLSSVESSDQSLELIIIRRNCGATTGYAYRVQISEMGMLGATEVVLRIGNVQNPESLVTMWSNDNVQITLPQMCRIYMKVTEVSIDGKLIRIEYNESTDSPVD